MADGTIVAFVSVGGVIGCCWSDYCVYCCIIIVVVIAGVNAVVIVVLLFPVLVL